jgi:hypothetical protein
VAPQAEPTPDQTSHQKEKCPQCGTVYTVDKPPTPTLVKLGMLVNGFVNRASPRIALSLVGAGLWAGLAQYGFATIWVV